MTLNAVVETASAHGGSELNRINYLDGWRGLAITLVLFGHFFPYNGLDGGRFGVDVFFCLSGMLMSNILFVRKVPLSIFYKRRISRIIPVFILFILFKYSMDWYVLGLLPWDELISNLFFLRTYIPSSPDIWHATGIIPAGHFWSLNIEEHSYLLLSLLTLSAFILKFKSTVLTLLGITSIITHIAYIKFPCISPPSAGLRTEALAANILLSSGYFLISHKTRVFIKPWMPLATLFLSALCYIEDITPWWSAMIISPFLLAFTINHLAETPELFKRLLSTPLLRLLGIWSYSIYVWQQPFFAYKNQLYPGSALPLALMVGIISFYFFENPMRALINNNWK